jgi:hypothetical protein
MRREAQLALGEGFFFLKTKQKEKPARATSAAARRCTTASARHRPPPHRPPPAPPRPAAHTRAHARAHAHTHDAGWPPPCATTAAHRERGREGEKHPHAHARTHAHATPCRRVEATPTESSMPRRRSRRGRAGGVVEAASRRVEFASAKSSGRGPRRQSHTLGRAAWSSGCVGGSSRRVVAGSATTAPRPTAAPRHKVRGERRG